MFSHVPWEYRYKGERGNGTKQEFWFLVVLLLAFQKTRAVPVGLIPLLRYAVHYWLAYGYHVWGGPWFFVLSTVLLCVNTNSSLLVLIVVYGRWTRSRSDRFMAYQRVNYIYIYMESRSSLGAGSSLMLAFLAVIFGWWHIFSNTCFDIVSVRQCV